MLMLYMSMLDTQEEKSKFEEIYIQYRKLMFVCAKSILKDDALAEDAVHNAFIKIIRHLKKISYIKCNQTKHFVVIVVESCAKDIYRRNAKQMEMSWEEMEQTYQFPEKDKMENLTPVEEAILNLPLTYRQIFVMKYAYGYTLREIAKILDMKESAVKQRIARGKKLLYTSLQEMGVYVGGYDDKHR